MAVAARRMLEDVMDSTRPQPRSRIPGMTAPHIARAFAALGACGDLMEPLNGAPLHLTRHRGDGWQAVLVRPELALRAALAFKAALRAEGAEFDSYIGIAEGMIALKEIEILGAAQYGSLPDRIAARVGEQTVQAA